MISQGMEFWHPNEDKTERACDFLPQEENKSYGFILLFFT
jgi:hypothetical protein